MSWGVALDVLKMKNVCRTTVALMAYASWVTTEDIQAQITWGAGQGPLIMANSKKNNKAKVINRMYSENFKLQWGFITELDRNYGIKTEFVFGAVTIWGQASTKDF